LPDPAALGERADRQICATGPAPHLGRRDQQSARRDRRRHSPRQGRPPNRRRRTRSE
jgi:hypothetical protein